MGLAPPIWFPPRGIFSPGAEIPPPKARAYFSPGGDIFFQRPARVFFAPRRHICLPSRATVAEICFHMFWCLRESSRPEDTQLKTYGTIFRSRPRAARNMFPPAAEICFRPGRKYFAPGCRIFCCIFVCAKPVLYWQGSSSPRGLHGQMVRALICRFRRPRVAKYSGYFLVCMYLCRSCPLQ